jgi:Fibronectin type III domain
MSDLGLEGANRPPQAGQEYPDISPIQEPRGRGTLITLATAVIVLLGLGLTAFGRGVTDNIVANFDASSWLWSSSRSEVDRVNGVTARVDTRTKIKDSQNHEVQVTQSDKYLILRDLETGQISALDLTTLQINAVMPTTPGLGVSVALHGEIAFVIDSVRGQVRQLDPRSLAPTGDAITLPNGLSAGDFDGTGTLWVGVPTEGTVVAIKPGTLGASPRVLHTVTVTGPGHDLVLSALDDGVAVLDNTDQKLLTVRGEKVSSATVPMTKPAQLPSRTGGSAVPITVAEDRHVIVVDGTKVSEFTVPGAGTLSPAVSFAGHVYCADANAGTVYEFDSKGKLVNQIRIPGAGGPLELDVRENHLFINAPDGSTARVVDENHTVKAVDKYTDGVLGGDSLPNPPQVQPPKLVVTVPGKPLNVVASAGNASARVTWRKAHDNGSAITKYVVGGGPSAITLGANQRAADIKGLTNGKTYRFTVYAVNAKGSGPKATSNAVIPTSDVPDAPISVTATAKPDGTVAVTWPAANGQGRKIIRYSVTAVTGGTQAPVSDVKTTTAIVAAGALTYGTQYAFTVVSVNDKGAGSAPSPLSNIVVPFTTPGPPRNLSAVTATGQRGAIQVSWQTAVDNGRPIQKYVVVAGGVTTNVTGTATTLNGFADDTAVQVTVHAVNEAGDGATATAAARTIGMPVITWTSDSAGYNSITSTFTPNNKGGAAICKLQVAGAGSTQVACTTAPVTLTVNGLWPNGTYSYTVSVTTAAGSATVTKTHATGQLHFTVICPNNVGGYCNGGVYAYQTPSQQGNAINPALPIGSTGTPQCATTGNRVIDATPWGAKKSNKWVRFTYRGATAYFPHAWAVLDGGDNLAKIPAC